MAKNENLVIVSILLKEQKIFFDPLSLNDCIFDSLIVADIIARFFEAYGRGIFCDDNNNFAYVPASVYLWAIALLCSTLIAKTTHCFPFA